MKIKNGKHDRSVMEMSKNPQLIGLERISACYIELPFLKTEEVLNPEEFLQREWTANGIAMQYYHYRKNGKNRFQRRRCNQLGAIDLLAYSSKQDQIWIVEYKCNDSEHQRKKAKEQLEEAKAGIERNYELRADHLLYVHNDFETEELIDGQWKETK